MFFLLCYLRSIIHEYHAREIWSMSPRSRPRSKECLLYRLSLEFREQKKNIPRLTMREYMVNALARDACMLTYSEFLPGFGRLRGKIISNSIANRLARYLYYPSGAMSRKLRVSSMTVLQTEFNLFDSDCPRSSRGYCSDTGIM
jgi:hypothetical protein